MAFDKKNLIINVALLCVGLASGILVTKFYPNNQTSDDYAVRQGGYNFINPLLTCNISENKQSDEVKPITDKFRSYIKEHIANGDAQQISVYFRAMDSGQWSGVNEDEEYSPGSLLKLPLAIALIKERTNNPDVLNDTLTYDDKQDENTAEYYKSSHLIQKGKTYNLSDLVSYMIIDSDNNAMRLLQNKVDKGVLSAVYSDLSLPIPDDLNQASISAKDYSYIFRILYNATYISKTMSQNLLEMMSRSDFKSGIVSGLPEERTVSHKFGERSAFIEDPKDNTNFKLDFRELHDCGIIYYPKTPYLLCVMTKGEDFDKLSRIIGDISAIIYNEVDKGLLKNATEQT